MPVNPRFAPLIENHSFDELEDVWLDVIETDTDIKSLADVAQAVAKAGADERARVLLQMLDEQLVDQEAWEKRLELLQRAGDLLIQPGKLHPTIIETLEKRWAHKPSYEGMAEKLGLHRAPNDIPKTWEKVNRLRILLAFDIGTIVRMEGKGAGRILEANLALESFKVALEAHGELRVGFRAANKVLTPLPEDHFLRRKYEEPEALAELGKEEPSKLLGALLSSFDTPRSAAEIKRDLVGLVPEQRWTSWWSAARKHPQVIASTKGRRSYRWAASSEDAHAAVWRAFEAATPRKKIDLLRRDGARDADLRRRMSKALATTASEVAENEPGLAVEIWLGLEKSGDLPTNVPWTPDAMLDAHPADQILAGIGDRVAREQIYQLIIDRHDDWQGVFARQLWRETEARGLDTLNAKLQAEAPQELETFFDQIVSQPRKAPPSFVWLAERAADDDTWRRRNPLRLLKQILWALGDNGFANLRQRLTALVDSGGTIPRLLGELNEEQAGQAEEAIQRSSVLADYQIDSLTTSLQLKYPSLRRDEEQPLYALADSIDRKREELRVLLEEEIPTNRTAIEEARALGDLRENFEYKSARQRHEYLTARATEMDAELRRSRPIDLSTVTGAEAVIGSRVHLEGESGERTVTILGPWESDPESGILSNESRMAKNLLGHKLDTEVQLGDETFRIKTITAYEPS